MAARRMEANGDGRSMRPRETDDTADRAAQARVHAWYASQNALGAATHAEQSASSPLTLASRSVHNSAPVKDPDADLATTAPKATADDFARAAAAQRLTIQSAAEQNSHQTTAADDAAATSHIPSTAPTEREPAPFVHGGGSSSLSAPSGRRTLPAAAPVVRETAGSTAAVNLNAPAALIPQPAQGLPHLNLRPSTLTSTSQQTAGTSDATILAANPIALAAGSSSRTVRTVAAETAGEPTPHLRMPAPPVATGRKPAIAAVGAGNAHPVLDPAVTAGMADETFDGDDTPATANTAIRLATTGVMPHGRNAETDDTGPLRPVVAVNVFDGGGHLMLLPPMKGTHEILVHQNQMAVADGLERVQNDTQLADMRRTKLLVALPDDDSMYPNDALPLNRRYARPWTVRFLRDLARSHYARFGTPLIVTSAVRTVAFQRQLVRVNGNAAPPSGDIASPHLYGQAIDLAKHSMSLTEITWMRAYLTPVEDEGKIDVEEEFQQACFHISVYRRYLGVPPRKSTAAPPALLQAKASQPAPPAEKKHRLPLALLATHLP